MRIRLATPLVCALLVLSACASEPAAASVTGTALTTTTSAPTTTTTTTIESAPEPLELSNDVLRAALYTQDDLYGAWKIRYSDLPPPCPDGPTPGPLSGSYQERRFGDEVFSIRFVRFPAGSPQPESVADAVIADVNCDPWEGNEESADVMADGRVRGTFLDPDTPSLYAALHENVLVLLEIEAFINIDSTGSGEIVPLLDGLPAPEMLIDIVDRLRTAQINLPVDLPEATPTTVPPEPEFPQFDGGCFARPAFSSRKEDMTTRLPKWLTDHVPGAFDLDGDGTADRIFSFGHSNESGFHGDLQAYLGEVRGWTTLYTLSGPFLLEFVADLDRDGRDELVFSYPGNGFLGIQIAYVDGCELRFVQWHDYDGSFSAGGIGKGGALRCIREGDATRIREDWLRIHPDILGASTHDWFLYELVAGEMVTVEQGSATLGPDDPLPDRQDSNCPPS